MVASSLTISVVIDLVGTGLTTRMAGTSSHEWINRVDLSSSNHEVVVHALGGRKVEECRGINTHLREIGIPAMVEEISHHALFEDGKLGSLQVKTFFSWRKNGVTIVIADHFQVRRNSDRCATLLLHDTHADVDQFEPHADVLIRQSSWKGGESLKRPGRSVFRERKASADHDASIDNASFIALRKARTVQSRKDMVHEQLVVESNLAWNIGSRKFADQSFELAHEGIEKDLSLAH